MTKPILITWDGRNLSIGEDICKDMSEIYFIKVDGEFLLNNDNDGEGEILGFSSRVMAKKYMERLSLNGDIVKLKILPELEKQDSKEQEFTKEEFRKTLLDMLKPAPRGICHDTVSANFPTVNKDMLSLWILYMIKSGEIWIHQGRYYSKRNYMREVEKQTKQ